MKEFFIIFFVIFFTCACSKNEDDKEVIPTIDNLTGAWQAVDYKLDGESVPGLEYEDDCILVQANKEFTARFSMRGGFFYGDVMLLGNDLKMETFDETIGITVKRMTRMTLSTTYNYNGKIYAMTFKRIVRPTTFQVKNDLFAGNKMINLISYCIDNGQESGFVYGNVHGTAPTGDISKQKVFTRHPDKMRIGCNVLDGYTVKKYVSVYPQKMEVGKHNILSLTDTTMVVDASFDGHVTKPVRLKDILGE